MMDVFTGSSFFREGVRVENSRRKRNFILCAVLQFDNSTSKRGEGYLSCTGKDQSGVFTGE